MSVTIDVRGMGLAIGVEVAIIRDALNKLGYKVITMDDYPSDKTDEDIIERVKCSDHKREAILIATHEPWPG